MSSLNFTLAGRLALRRLLHQPMVSLATALGVALGMAVVGSILIVDYNSSESIARYYSDSHWLAQGTGREVRDRPDDILSVYFLAAGRTPPARPTGVERSVTDKVLRAAGSPASAQGEEDYHAMRIAVRLTSVLAFAVGAITVFFTLRYSVAARASEFSLLLCLGERRATAILSLVTQALVFGVAGTAFGTVLAIPIGRSATANGDIYHWADTVAGIHYAVGRIERYGGAQCRHFHCRSSWAGDRST